MSITDEVKEKIQQGIPDVAVLEIQDFSDGVCNGAKLEVLVVSDAFDKKPLLKRHRMVNDLLKDDMDRIHALTLKTYTVAQYESKQ